MALLTPSVVAVIFGLLAYTLVFLLTTYWRGRQH